MQPLRNLELHLAHACNLHCESCSHYSNQGQKGLLTLEVAARWMADWQHRIDPAVFTLLGGEPSLNPDLAAFIPLCRRFFPRTRLNIVSNGSFLHRHPDLPRAMAADPDSWLDLSIHHDAPEYLDSMRPVLALLEGWKAEHGIGYTVRESFRKWTRRYRGWGSAMAPYDDRDPRRSWSVCPAKGCFQLHEGAIWKCAPLAYLPLQNARHPLSERWQPYLRYQPLRPDCSDAELRDFFARKDEPFCAMCPAEPEHFSPPLPTRPPPAEVAPRPVLPSGHGFLFAARYQARPAPPRSRQPQVMEALRSRIDVLPLPLAEEPRTGWRMHPLFKGQTRTMTHLSCHASVLDPGVVPHPPHQHVEEEILLMLAGEADLLISEDGRPDSPVRRIPLRPGGFVYYPAFHAHSLCNSGDRPATYLMFKWRGPGGQSANALGVQLLQDPRLPAVEPGRAVGFRIRRLLQGGTDHLGKLHAHATVLQPGAGYAAHADPYDVAILLTRGEVQTLGRVLVAPGVIFYAAGEPHGMLNPGAEPAEYLVFEFHRRDLSA